MDLHLPRLSLPLAIAVALAAGSADARDFVRADANTDGTVNIADAVTTLDYLFGGGVGYCLDAMDSNDDGTVDISDPIVLIGFLFSAGPAPAPPFGQCGADPTADNLGCDSHAVCNFGDAIPGLTPEELADFLSGRELMSKVFTPEEGLGPLFNASSCEACHSHPVVGGSAPIYRNFMLVAKGNPGAQVAVPIGPGLPNLPSLVMPAYGAIDGNRPRIPTSSQVGGLPVTSAHRNAPPFLGVGLFEFVSNATIFANSDPNDLNGDGISGRYNADAFGNFGRFGYKLQANFIEAFIRGASFNQMGITTNPVLGSDGVVSYRFQVGAGFDTPTFDNDGAPDPEISVADFGDIIAFNRFVAPPPRLTFGPDEQAGDVLFDQMNCDSCHHPTIDSSVGQLGAYTDLLLHNMGPDLADGISMGMPQFSTLEAFHTGQEFRTQPLWGVRLHGPWLHDGRADSLNDAIILHGGEATAARDAYLGLTPLEQDAVIKFLEAL